MPSDTMMPFSRKNCIAFITVCRLMPISEAISATEHTLPDLNSSRICMRLFNFRSEGRAAFITWFPTSIKTPPNLIAFIISIIASAFSACQVVKPWLHNIS